METEEAHKIEASLREVRENAGEIWWGTFLEKRTEQINRRFKLARLLYWGPSVNMPLDLFSYIREASLCFTIARYLSTIVFSSSAVELILNKDRRTRDLNLRRIGGWATLNNQNLSMAGGQGLPVDDLVSANENLADARPVRFVERRNKVAHGEIAPMFRSLSDYDPRAEQEAFDQLEKSQRFVVNWFNSAPDVQESHIQNHQWPVLTAEE